MQMPQRTILSRFVGAWSGLINAPATAWRAFKHWLFSPAGLICVLIPVWLFALLASGHHLNAELRECAEAWARLGGSFSFGTILIVLAEPTLRETLFEILVVGVMASVSL